MNINFISPICHTGYGIAGYNIVKKLIEEQHDIALFPITQSYISSPEIQKAERNAVFFNYDAPCVRLWHQFDLSQFVGRGKHIGFPIFELDTFTPIERHHLYGCDEIFVCSEWAKSVVVENLYNEYKFSANKITKVVPLGVDTDIFYPPIIRPNSVRGTVFLNVGKWETRKGHDELVSWFNKAFEPNDNVQLWLLIYNPFLTEQQNRSIIEGYKNTKLGNKILIIPRQQTSEQVANIMRKADCGVFPARAEGWNLDLLEMLACGCHAITTNYSAHTEFCSSPGVRLAEIKELEMAFGKENLDDRWFNGQGRWAKLDSTVEEFFIESMRYIHKEYLGINEEGLKIANKFTWKNSIDCLLKNLEN